MIYFPPGTTTRQFFEALVFSVVITAGICWLLWMFIPVPPEQLICK